MTGRVKKRGRGSLQDPDGPIQVVWPRRKCKGDGDSEEGGDSQRNFSVQFSLEMLAPHLKRPLTEASRELGVSATAIKKACRKLGIPRWPARALTASKPSKRTLFTKGPWAEKGGEAVEESLEAAQTLSRLGPESESGVREAAARPGGTPHIWPLGSQLPHVDRGQLDSPGSTASASDISLGLGNGSAFTPLRRPTANVIVPVVPPMGHPGLPCGPPMACSVQPCWAHEEFAYNRIAAAQKMANGLMEMVYVPLDYMPSGAFPGAIMRPVPMEPGAAVGFVPDPRNPNLAPSTAHGGVPPVPGVLYQMPGAVPAHAAAPMRGMPAEVITPAPARGETQHMFAENIVSSNSSRGASAPLSHGDPGFGTIREANEAVELRRQDTRISVPSGDQKGAGKYKGDIGAKEDPASQSLLMEQLAICRSELNAMRDEVTTLRKELADTSGTRG